MKKNLFLAALAMPLIFGACSNEDLATSNASDKQEGLVEIGSDFVLTAKKGVEQDGTRAEWMTNSGKTLLAYAWIPKANGTEAVLDEIGLCWVGNAVTDKVYTNYKFKHNGWLKQGETEAEIDPCDGSVTNGYTLSAPVYSGTQLNNDTDLDILSATDWDGWHPYATIGGTNYMLETGFFTTASETMFGGDYIVYSPFNPDFKDQGHVIATSPATTAIDLNDGFAHLGDEMFAYGYAEDLIGGTQASDFSFNNLSGMIRVRVDGALTGVTAMAIVDEAGNFVTKVGLDATKIVAGAKGTALYVTGEKETTHALYATLTSAGTDNDIYFAALPTTTGNLKVVFYNGTTELSAVYAASPITVTAGGIATIEVEVEAIDFNKNVAVDQTSLAAMIGNSTSTNPLTITLLNDVTLSSDLTINNYATVQGYNIIVPEDKYLDLDEYATVKSGIVVKGQPCCVSTTNPGRLFIKNNVKIDGSVTALASDDANKSAGYIEFVGDKVNAVTADAEITSAGNVIFNGATDICGTLTVNGKAIVASAADVNVKGGIVENNGTFEVKGNGKFAMLDASGSTVAAAGKKFYNNGDFIDNVGATVGGATQYMTFGTEGEYICRVTEQKRLDEAFINKKACSIIEIVDGARGYFVLNNAVKHNNSYIDFIVSATDPVGFEVTGGSSSSNAKAANIGNVEVKSGSDFWIRNTKIYNTLSVHGDITVAGSMTTEKDVQEFTANNLTVLDGGAVEFWARVEATGKTLAVSGTIDVQEGASFTIVDAVGNENIAYITCTKLIEGGTFYGKPDVIE